MEAALPEQGLDLGPWDNWLDIWLSLHRVGDESTPKGWTWILVWVQNAQQEQHWPGFGGSGFEYSEGDIRKGAPRGSFQAEATRAWPKGGTGPVDRVGVIA